MFISAISPKGCVSLFDGKTSNFTHTFVLEDSFGLGHFILTPILKASQDAEFECIACQNPLIPERLEHLIIPELSLAFITSEKEHPYTGEYYRKIRIDALINSDIMRTKKQRISLLKKAKNAILDFACEVLREAKLVHDVLEDLYNPHINFEKLYKYADTLAGEIIG